MAHMPGCREHAGKVHTHAVSFHDVSLRCSKARLTSQTQGHFPRHPPRIHTCLAKRTQVTHWPVGNKGGKLTHLVSGPGCVHSVSFRPALGLLYLLCSNSGGSLYPEVGRAEPWGAAALLMRSEVGESVSGEADSLLQKSFLFKV